VLLSGGVKGMKSLHKSIVIDPIITINGDDVLVSGGGITS
jgi:hypothetical protein